MNASRNAAPRGRRPGVTLLELLTVIALIAILVAIIFPVLSRANEAARTTTCASNLRQIAFAMLAYAHDYRSMPWSEDPANPGKPVGAGDFEALQFCARHYMLNTGLCQCPSDRENRAGIGNTRLNEDASVRASYDVLTAWSIPVGKREWSRIRDFTRLPMAWDLYGGLSRERAAALPEAEQREAVSAANHFPRGGNVAYADGHALWKNAQDWADTNDPGIPERLKGF